MPRIPGSTWNPRSLLRSVCSTYPFRQRPARITSYRPPLSSILTLNVHVVDSNILHSLFHPARAVARTPGRNRNDTQEDSADRHRGGDAVRRVRGSGCRRLRHWHIHKRTVRVGRLQQGRGHRALDLQGQHPHHNRRFGLRPGLQRRGVRALHLQRRTELSAQHRPQRRPRRQRTRHRIRR